MIPKVGWFCDMFLFFIFFPHVQLTFMLILKGIRLVICNKYNICVVQLTYCGDKFPKF